MVQPADEWAQINMAYDPSYAEEAILAESNTIDKELEGKEIKYYDPATLSAKNEPTDAEILDYLKDHTTDTDILNQY
jgi:antitoxin component YwqK of YwqJK toxin-antitoxin module